MKTDYLIIDNDHVLTEPNMFGICGARFLARVVFAAAKVRYHIVRDAFRFVYQPQAVKNWGVTK